MHRSILGNLSSTSLATHRRAKNRRPCAAQTQDYLFDSETAVPTCTHTYITNEITSAHMQLWCTSETLRNPSTNELHTNRKPHRRGPSCNVPLPTVVCRSHPCGAQVSKLPSDLYVVDCVCGNYSHHRPNLHCRISQCTWLVQWCAIGPGIHSTTHPDRWWDLQIQLVA